MQEQGFKGARLGLLLILAPWLLGAAFLAARLDINPTDDATTIAQIEAEAATRKAVRPEACIVQYAASERWLKHQHVYECVTAAREIPSHVFSSPLQR